MQGRTKAISFLLAMLILFTGGTAALAASEQAVNAAIEDTAAYVYQAAPNPQVGSIGGEWAVLGLARGGYPAPEKYYNDYRTAVERYVKEHQGVLHDKKYTEYSRVILGLTAAGYDPTGTAGYDLTMALGDFEKTIWQGINGPVFALLALDSGNYSIPRNSGATVQATRDMYVNEILRRQLPDGGFSLLGGTEGATVTDQKADPDITAMALQALAKYQDRADVKKVTEEALACLSTLQNDQGGYISWGDANSESVSQVIVALTELGIPLDDARFVKNGKSLVDNLLSFYTRGQGFSHTAGDISNQMSTEQALYALVAVRRAREGKSSLYRMTDTVRTGAPAAEKDTGKGLPGRHADVRVRPPVAPGQTFDDIATHAARPAVEALAARGIIGGKGERLFDPDATMTRAEFAVIIVKGLGLPEKTGGTFTDVPADSWYAGSVGAAYSYGIAGGDSAATFNPNGTITREEAAVMTARAAKLTGMETDLAEGAVRDMLAQFVDYISSSDWARPALAFCYQEDILPQEEIQIRPGEAVKRHEVAGMLYRLLGAANLL